ncbi:MAG: CBS domain-containing protein [Desulfocapsaceae bacterium]|nr:CBS domain-containing protein [Desulfocapsaceae bacterium]
MWQKPLEDICKKSTRIHVRDIMYTPAEGEYVSQQASLDEAIHQLVISHHQSLLVVEDNNATGIMRLTDVLKPLPEIINQCEI